jgi:hypothetical protein
MKNKIILLTIITVLLYSCSDEFLKEKNETDLSVDFIYDTPEGIGFAVTALYPIQRYMADYGDINHSLPTLGLLTGDDITFTRAGENFWKGTAWYDPTTLTSANKDVEGFWNYNYKIIGRANEIIFYALKMDQNNALVKQALSEAYCFRAQAYFNLLRRFDNIYFTTDPVTPYNLNDAKVYEPADQAVVMTQIKSDLDYAINHLSWTTPQTGRYTKGASCHMKALVDMWPINDNLSTMDLDDAILNVEKIKTQGVYSLVAQPQDVFAPATVSATSAKINNSEAIMVDQWSIAIGGAPTNSVGTLAGHRMASTFLSRYDRIPGNTPTPYVVLDLEQGGTPWGRIYPNDYLLSLYDKVNDKRFTQYFIQYFKFNNIPVNTPLVRTLVIQAHDLKYLYVNGLPNPDLGLPASIITQLQGYVPFTSAINKILTFSFKNGDNIPRFMVANYANELHPSSSKYFDKWTRPVIENRSFKDILVYRYAETCLIGAEAYLRKGNQAKALEFYNLTWQRAGNAKRVTSLTLQDILDEDAREFSQEGQGHRWYVLKRFGAATMATQINTYSGSDNYLMKIFYAPTTGKTNITTNVTNADNYKLVRTNFNINVNRRWPIPLSQINAMGGAFPQNAGYN